MKMKHMLSTAATCAILSPALAVFAQAPARNISPQKHANLAAAQTSISHAYQKIEMAQQANHNKLGDHAQRAKELLSQASHELQLAAEYANQHK